MSNKVIEILEHMLEHGFFYNSASSDHVIFLPVEYQGEDLTKEDIRVFLEEYKKKETQP